MRKELRDLKGMKELSGLLEGLTYSEWSMLKMSVDMYFSKKIANLKIDDKKELDIFINADH